MILIPSFISGIIIEVFGHSLSIDYIMIISFSIIVIGHHYIYHVQVSRLESSSSSALSSGRSIIPLNLKKILSHILSDYNSKRLFIYLMINLLFMFVELGVGIITNSLGLISDAGHMLFDSTYKYYYFYYYRALALGLIASYMTKWKSNEIYTYGYERAEVLSGFVNGIFLVFVAFSVAVEAIERIKEPPEVHTGHLIPVAVGGLLVNLIGMVFFHEEGHSHVDEHGV